MKRIIISCIFALFTFLSILLYFDIFKSSDTYNILYTLLFFFLWYFYFKFKYKKIKKDNIYSCILSLIVSLSLSSGRIGMYIYDQPYDFLIIKYFIYFFIMFIGFNILFFQLFYKLLQYIKKVNILEKHKDLSMKNTIFIILIILLAHGFYFIRFYPAIMTPDSYYVITYANNFILSDFHTFGHTWFFGIPFHIGKALFGNLNAAVAFSTIFQMICSSLIFTIAIKYLYNKGLNKKITILLIAVYALNPLYAHYSITLWRDVMFGNSCILLLICLYEFISNDVIKKKYIVMFIIGMLILLFFRNNGIYAFIFMIPFMIIIIKNHRKLMTVLTFSILLFYIVIKGPVFNYFNVERTKSFEAYSIPLQQMARVVAMEKDIDTEDKLFLEQLWEYDKVKSTYANVTSDPIKGIINEDFLKNNKKDFFKTYFHLFIKYPKIYLEAYMMETFGYWNPDVIYWATGGESKGFFDTEDVYCDPLTPDWYNNIIDFTTKRNIPLCNLIWSVGLYSILFIISSILVLYKNKKYFVCYIPLYGIWLSIMASTPVFCELRYVYGIFACMPILIVIPLINNKKTVKD